MSSENEEKRPRSQSSFSVILDRIRKAAQDTVQTSISICQSTAPDEANTLFFVVDTANEDNFSELGEKLEEVLGYPEWRIIREKSESQQSLKNMYKNLTLLSSDNAPQVEAIIDQAKDQSKKLKGKQ